MFEVEQLRTPVISKNNNGTRPLQGLEPDLTAIICTSGRYELLSGLLASLIPEFQGEGGDVILIVDNSPPHERQPEFPQKYMKYGFIKFISENVPGLSLARNTGLALADTDLVAYLDDDAIVHPGWLKAIKMALGRSRSYISGVAGKVNLRWPGEVPDWIDPRLMGYLGHLDLGPAPRVLSTHEFPVGCNMAFRRDDLLALGGFALNLGRTTSSKILLSNEDLEIAMRMRAAGMALEYSPAASIDHCVDPARINEEWFGRRMEGQAISEIVVPGGRLRSLLVRAFLRRPLLALTLIYYRYAARPRGKHLRAKIIYLNSEKRFDAALIKHFWTRIV